MLLLVELRVLVETLVAVKLRSILGCVHPTGILIHLLLHYLLGSLGHNLAIWPRKLLRRLLGHAHHPTTTLTAAIVHLSLILLGSLRVATAIIDHHWLSLGRPHSSIIQIVR